MLKVSAMYLSSAASEARKSVRRIIPPCTLLYSLRTKDATESSTISLMFFWMMSSSTLCSLKQQKHSWLKLLSNRQFFYLYFFYYLDATMHCTQLRWVWSSYQRHLHPNSAVWANKNSYTSVFNHHDKSIFATLMPLQSTTKSMKCLLNKMMEKNVQL